jgi:hypothetical protein
LFFWEEKNRTNHRRKKVNKSEIVRRRIELARAPPFLSPSSPFKMTDADMADAPPASTADVTTTATAAAAAKALAKGKAPANDAAAPSADALARAAATAASAPWIEKYRPNTLDDVASHGEIIETSEWW